MHEKHLLRRHMRMFSKLSLMSPQAERAVEEQLSVDDRQPGIRQT
jgi:hypothetical protein